MAKMKLLTGRAGYDNSGRIVTQSPGAEIEVGSDEAVRMVQAGIAVPAEEPRRTATVGPPERRAGKKGK